MPDSLTPERRAVLRAWYVIQDFCHCSNAYGGEGSCEKCDEELKTLAALIEPICERVAVLERERDEALRWACAPDVGQTMPTSLPHAVAYLHGCFKGASEARTKAEAERDALQAKLESARSMMRRMMW